MWIYCYDIDWNEYSYKIHLKSINTKLFHVKQINVKFYQSCHNPAQTWIDIRQVKEVRKVHVKCDEIQANRISYPISSRRIDDRSVEAPSRVWKPGQWNPAQNRKTGGCHAGRRLSIHAQGKASQRGWDHSLFWKNLRLFGLQPSEWTCQGICHTAGRTQSGNLRHSMSGQVR